MAMGFNIDVDVPKVVTIGAVSVIILVVILAGTHGYYLKYDRGEFAAKYYPATSPLVDDTNKLAAERLHAYRWANEQKSAAAIPIDTAIKIMVQTKGRPPTTQPLGSSGNAGG
jgi:hypothetical protein